MNFTCLVKGHIPSFVLLEGESKLFKEGCKRCKKISNDVNIWYYKSAGTYVRAINCRCQKGLPPFICSCSNLVEMGEIPEVCSSCLHGTHMMPKGLKLNRVGNDTKP